MKIKIPETTIFGEPVKGAMERVLKKQESVSEPVAVSGNINPSEYLQIPGTNTIISKFELPDYNSLDWKDTHFKIQENGLLMPTPNLFMTHFLNVVDAYKNRKPLFDAAGNPLSDSEKEDLYKYLTPHTSGDWTWLDVKFKGNLRKKTMEIHTNHRIVNNELKPQTIQDLEQCIEEDCYVKLDFNSQGLPTKKSENQEYVQGENLYFWYPRNGEVAMFINNSSGPILFCNSEPIESYPHLGVFACASGTSQRDSKDFIYVPSIKSYVAKEKTLHDLTWNQAHEELKKKGSRMPTIPEFIGFVNHLKQKPTPEYNKILDEILTVGNSWRAEYLDARFEEIKGEMHVHYAGKTEKLDPSTLIMKNRYTSEIDIDYWLKNSTNQGLPPTNTPTGGFHYQYPKNEKVAGFGADSDRIYFCCDWELNGFDSRLGVREVRNTVP